MASIGTVAFSLWRLILMEITILSCYPSHSTSLPDTFKSCPQFFPTLPLQCCEHSCQCICIPTSANVSLLSLHVSPDVAPCPIYTRLSVSIFRTSTTGATVPPAKATRSEEAVFRTPYAPVPLALHDLQRLPDKRRTNA